MTSAEKFCKPSLLTKHFADLISQERQNIFEDKMKYLVKPLSSWQKNISFEILGKENCSPGDQASLKCDDSHYYKLITIVNYCFISTHYHYMNCHSKQNMTLFL